MILMCTIAVTNKRFVCHLVNDKCYGFELDLDNFFFAALAWFVNDCIGCCKCFVCACMACVWGVKCIEKFDSVCCIYTI